MFLGSGWLIVGVWLDLDSRCSGDGVDGRVDACMHDTGLPWMDGLLSNKGRYRRNRLASLSQSMASHFLVTVLRELITLIPVHRIT